MYEQMTVSTCCKVSFLKTIPVIIDILMHEMYRVIILIELQNFVPRIRAQHHLIVLLTLHAKCSQLSESVQV